MASTSTAPTTALESSKTVPTYAAICEGTPRYVSACSCYGITSQVVKATEKVGDGCLNSTQTWAV